MGRAGRLAAVASLTRLRSARAATPPQPKLRVAAILTEFTYRSHAHVILENFLVPYLFNGQWVDPQVEITGLYVDQFPEGDMARAVAEQFHIPIFSTIGEAVLAGGLPDGVLSIGEHGQYPVNAKSQQEYPRKRFFDEIVAAFGDAPRPPAVFNDKHLSYRWDWARQMVDTANRRGIPLLAGSSVPLAQRRPPLELNAGTQLVEAVSIHGGGIESYDFHCLEVLQSFVEWRPGGETGVEQVQFLSGDALWQAAERGLWSPELAHAAMTAELGPGLPPLAELATSPRIGASPPHGILVTYRDGFRALALKLGASSTRWNFACRVAGESEPRATSLYVGPWENRNLFRALSHAIQTHFRTRVSPYPVERTLLVTGALDAAMDSRVGGEHPVATPHLDFSYTPRDFRSLREMGDTWKLITDETPQPSGIEPVGPRS